MFSLKSEMSMLWPTGYKITVQKKVFFIQTPFRLKKFVSSTCLQARPIRLDASSLTCDQAIFFKIFYYYFVGEKNRLIVGYILPDLRPTTVLYSRFIFSVTRVLKKRRQRRQRKWQKINRLRLAMNNISLFCTFLIRRCTTTTCNFLISRVSSRT